MNDMQDGDDLATSVAITPRVTRADFEAKVVGEYYFTASQAVAAIGAPAMAALDALTICIFVMRNGSTIIGKSAPANPANFNAELGRKFARQDALRQVWPMDGYAICNRPHAGD